MVLSLDQYGCYTDTFSCLREHRPEEQLYEYKWPLEGHADTYMLQEQISEYLGVLSFKRKYPGR